MSKLCKEPLLEEQHSWWWGCDFLFCGCGTSCGVAKAGGQIVTRCHRSPEGWSWFHSSETIQHQWGLKGRCLREVEKFFFSGYLPTPWWIKMRKQTAQVVQLLCVCRGFSNPPLKRLLLLLSDSALWSQQSICLICYGKFQILNIIQNNPQVNSDALCKVFHFQALGIFLVLCASLWNFYSANQWSIQGPVQLRNAGHCEHWQLCYLHLQFLYEEWSVFVEAFFLFKFGIKWVKWYFLFRLRCLLVLIYIIVSQTVSFTALCSQTKNGDLSLFIRPFKGKLFHY